MDTDRISKTGCHEDLLYDEIHNFLALTLESVRDLMCELGQHCDMSKKPLVIYVVKIFRNGLSYQNISDLITGKIKQNTYVDNI